MRGTGVLLDILQGWGSRCGRCGSCQINIVSHACSNLRRCNLTQNFLAKSTKNWLPMDLQFKYPPTHYTAYCITNIYIPSYKGNCWLKSHLCSVSLESWQQFNSSQLPHPSLVCPVDAGSRGTPWCHNSYTSAPCWPTSCHCSSSDCKQDNKIHPTHDSYPGKVFSA